MTRYSYGNYGFIQHERMETQPLFLIDTGIEHRGDSSYYFDNSNRPSYGGYLLQYTLKGNGVFLKNEEKYILKEGFCFFSKIPENSCYYYDKASQPPYPSSEVHSSHSPREEWEYFYLHFDGSAASDFYKTINELTNGVFYLPPEHACVRLFFRLIDNYSRKGFLELYEGGEFLYRFLSGVLRELEAPTDNVSSPIHTAVNYMREHFATINSIAEVSAACNISAEHLSRSFQKEKGQSPLQFLTKLRIEHALFLLLNTNDEIEKIALSCGYLNGNYFAKVFKKYLHCSPTEYRRRN